jgi:DeoR/GlpR family transcriptional regulator of sugar metabolism
MLILLNAQPQIGCSDLARILAVSPRTVERDIQALAQEGQPIGLRGTEVVLEKADGAPIESSFSVRLRTNVDAKRTLARWAASLVNDGDAIVMDASTTVYAMAPFLARRRNLVIFTNCIELGRCLAANPSNTVILVAGVVRPDGSSVIGPLYKPVLHNHGIKTAFVSCKGFSLAAGLTETDMDEAAVKAQLVNLAQTTVALIDSSKFGQVYPAPFARASQVGHIFVEGGLDAQWLDQVTKASIVVTRCLEPTQDERRS